MMKFLSFKVDKEAKNSWNALLIWFMNNDTMIEKILSNKVFVDWALYPINYILDKDPFICNFNKIGIFC